jgi:hypothetical protein
MKDNDSMKNLKNTHDAETQVSVMTSGINSRRALT